MDLTYIILYYILKNVKSRAATNDFYQWTNSILFLINQELKVLPDDVWGGQGGQQSHGQTKAEVIGPVPLNIGQPLVHLNALNKHKQTRFCLSAPLNQKRVCLSGDDLLGCRM